MSDLASQRQDHSVSDRSLGRALRIFPLVLLALGVGLTVGVQDGRLSQGEVLLILILAGVLATYRVFLAVLAVPRRMRQAGFWLTLPVLGALVLVAPAFAGYALAQAVEAWVLFGGLASWRRRTRGSRPGARGDLQ